MPAWRRPRLACDQAGKGLTASCVPNGAHFTRSCHHLLLCSAHQASAPYRTHAGPEHLSLLVTVRTNAQSLLLLLLLYG